MGYIANISIALKVKQGMEEELMEKIRTAEGIDWDHIFDGDSPSLQDSDQTHKVLCGQYYSNYDDTDWYAFLKLIAPYIEDGQEIECNGEDHSDWVFYKENGKWYEGQYKYTIDKEKAKEI